MDHYPLTEETDLEVSTKIRWHPSFLLIGCFRTMNPILLEALKGFNNRMPPQQPGRTSTSTPAGPRVGRIGRQKTSCHRWNRSLRLLSPKPSKAAVQYLRKGHLPATSQRRRNSDMSTIPIWLATQPLPTPTEVRRHGREQRSGAAAPKIRLVLRESMNAPTIMCEVQQEMSLVHYLLIFAKRF